jgi:hypothetical protein
MDRRLLMSTAVAALLGGSSFTTPALAQKPLVPLFPNIVGVKVRPRGAGAFDFDVTVSSAYDRPERYADAFRVMAGDGKVFGERVLLHDHMDEQPFTRDLHGVVIPAGVREVVVQGRDQKSGYGGKSMTVKLPGR